MKPDRPATPFRRDKRNAARRMLRYTGWISFGSDELHGCVIADISDTGARLKVEKARSVPDEFFLRLSARGKSRQCFVVWRTADQVGCQFERPLSTKEKTRPILKAEKMTPPLPMPSDDAAPVVATDRTKEHA